MAGNGNLPPSQLTAVPPGRLEKNAARAWNAPGGPAANGCRLLGPNSGYRTYASQAYYWGLYTSGRGNLAARPGTSNHGWGRAVDLASPSMRTWIDRHGAALRVEENRGVLRVVARQLRRRLCAAAVANAPRQRQETCPRRQTPIPPTRSDPRGAIRQGAALPQTRQVPQPLPRARRARYAGAPKAKRNVSYGACSKTRTGGYDAATQPPGGLHHRRDRATRRAHAAHRQPRLGDRPPASSPGSWRSSASSTSGLTTGASGNAAKATRYYPAN